MKKGLIALLLTLPMLLTSCLDSSDSTPDPMGPGISIYNAARTKNQLAMVPADAGLRLAMLLAEADKQGLTENRLDVKVDGKSVKQALFSNDAVITEEGTKYTIEFRKGEWYYYYGTVEVETGGTSWSDDGFGWTITTSGLKADVHNGLNTVVYEYSDEGTTELFNGSGLSISLTDIVLESGDNAVLDGWSGRFDLEGFGAYSDCHGKEFKLNGEAEDANLSWNLKNVYYKGAENSLTGQIAGLLLSGEVTCRFVNLDYDKETFPSPWVKISFSNNGQSYTIFYNGQQSTR